MLSFFRNFIISILALVGLSHAPANLSPGSSPTPTANEQSYTFPSDNSGSTNSAKPSAPSASSAATATVTTSDSLVGLGGTKYADGILPLGDNKYVTTGPKKGYVYLCNPRTDGGGAQAAGSWISGNTWNINKKISAQGDVAWSNASINMSLSGGYRVITTNDLPATHHTGIFPISSDDPAYQFDRNPNSIKTQSLSFKFPAAPQILPSPACIGGEVGIMTSGVMLFDAFDALLRDAVAREVQDSCDGHPQVSGEYHYHGLSRCFKDPPVSQVIGYAFDGFPITGPALSGGKYLTTDDLDECHGLTSEIVLDGKKVMTYHYVMTIDFPYSVSCFRGKSTVNGPTSGTGSGAPSGGTAGQVQQGSVSGTPPQEAITACQGKSTNSSCSFVSPYGDTISGTCQIPPGMSSPACVPAGGPPQ